MKNTTNVFLDGIITDQNPLTIPQTALTSALNATILTGNGNEGLLLNDMGNTLIKDSITGNVMSLNDGFIPLGMKEYGGVLYIASYNPQTKEGELGSIPSPVIHYTYESEEVKELSIKITDLQPGDENLNPKINTSIIYLSDRTFHAGDKFIPVLNISNSDTTLDRLYINGTITYPYVSTVDTRGWYKIKLYVVTDNNSEILLDDITNTKQKYIDSSGKVQTSNYWYITTDDLENHGLDEEQTKIHNYYRTFPNVRAGKLAIKIEPELHENLEYTINDSYNNNYPSIFVDSNSDIFVVINGLKYSGSCGILPDKIEIIVNGKESPILYKAEDFTILDEPLKIGAGNRLKTTYKDNGEFFISNQLFDDSKNIINYQDASLAYNICAIKIDNFMSTVNVQVKLYVNDLEDNPIYYRTDSLPSFTPAEVELGLSETQTTSVDLYLLIKDDREFDIKLFNNISNDDQRCFIYKTFDDKILTFDNNTGLYELSSAEATLDNYKLIKSWIYPLYGVRCDNDENWKTQSYHESAILAPRLLGLCKDIPLYGGRDSSFKINKFVVCSEQPTVHIEGKLDPIPLLLPVATRDWPSFEKETYDQFIEQFLNQRTFFYNHRNKFGLTPSDIKNNCLFNVNLNIINEGFETACTEWGNILGQNRSMPGYDKFWDRKDSGILDDAVLDIFPAEEDYTILYISEDDKLGLLTIASSTTDPKRSTSFPKILTKKATTDILTYNYYCNESGLPYITWYSKYVSAWLPAPGIYRQRDSTIESWLKDYATNPSGNPLEYFGGYISTELQTCPGYFDNIFSLKFKLFDYSYPLEYLYNKPINLRFHNFGNKDIFYFKAFMLRLYYTAAITGNYFGYLEDGFTLKSILTKGTEEPITQTTNVSPINNNVQSDKITLNESSILTQDEECTILPSDNKYTVEYILKQIDPKNTLERRLVLTPQIFLEVLDNSLRRTYRSDYQIIRQFDIENNGFYLLNNKWNLVKSNIESDINYLLNSLLSNLDVDETLEIYGIENLLSPLSLGLYNSFCFSQGYFPLIAGSISDNTIINKTIQNINSGIYVLHVNHNGIFVSNDAVQFKLTLTMGSIQLEKIFKGDYVAFKISLSGLLKIKLTYSSDYQNLYIKNLGLYKLSEAEDKWVQIADGFKYTDLINKCQELDLYIYNNDESLGIVFPAVFCFKEMCEDNLPLGCLNVEFTGFQSLPSYSWQRCVGNYLITKDRKAIIRDLPYCNSKLAKLIVPEGTIIQSLREQ